MLVDLNAEIHQLRLEQMVSYTPSSPELLIQKAELDQKLSMKIWMVLGEGAVFVFILILGFLSVQKSIAKELALAEQQKNFVLSVTHELKSPLAAVKLFLQTLQTRKLPEEKKEQLYVKALIDTERLEKLIENLLLVNRVESGGFPLVRSEVDVSGLVTEMAHHNYQRHIDSGDLALEINPRITAYLDQMAFQSIFINLVDNSFKYGAGGKVSVDLSLDNENFVLLVADQGTGIAAEERERIFERFYRQGSEDVRKTKGTGIGLYLVKLFVEIQGGTITVEDNTPRGTKFLVRIPTVAALPT
jgi:signal transduction histidine kinase